MRRLACVICLFAVSVIEATASPCTVGTLANYVGLGSTGCTIGQNTYFNFQSLGISAGSTQIVPSAVTITPSGGSYNPSLTVVVNQSAGPNTTYETVLNYSVKGTSYLSELMTLSGSSESGAGGVSDTVNYCEGGPFGPNGVTGCTGKTGGTGLVDGVLNSDTFGFDPVSFLSLTDDIAISGGFSSGDSASGATVSDQLKSVPEPASYLLAAIALSFAIIIKSRLPRRG